MVMQPYAKVDRVTGNILDRRLLEDPERSLTSATVWLPIADAGPPPFDPATQSVTRTETVPDLSDPMRPVPETAKITVTYQVSNHPAPTYRDLRHIDYRGIPGDPDRPGIGLDPGNDIRTLGDACDNIIKELRAIRPAIDQNPDFRAMVVMIDAIKARHPKP